MDEFTGLEYLKIDIANCFGLDKKTWKERLNWVEINKNCLEDRTGEINPKKQIMYKKAVIALRKVMRGEPTGHVMYLDSTSSGYQHMAVLSGCKQTALYTNLLDPTTRYNLYQVVADMMNKELPPDEQVDADLIKKPTMTHAYNKQTQETLSTLQEKVFDKVLINKFPGKDAVMGAINKFWDWDAEAHTVIMPDKHVAYIPVTHMVNAKIEVDELDHKTFTYRFAANIPDNARPWYCKSKKPSLVPHITHMCDAYAARQLIRKCWTKGVQVLPIHDAAGFHPNNGNTVRKAYMHTMSEMANQELLQYILKQLGFKGKVAKLSKNLHKYILNSNYMLS